MIWFIVGFLAGCVFCFFIVGAAMANSEYDEVTEFAEVVRCKDCRWFNTVGCAINIVDESDKPKETDYCCFGERRCEE